MSEIELSESLAEKAANAIDPKMFEPAIRKAADDFYDQLLNGVQDYLKDNIEFNLSSHLLMLHGQIKSLKDMNKEIVEAAGQYMSQFGQALDCNGIAYGPPQKDADERLRAAIAKATS